ncbi:MAG: 30S ribosomal protein S12 methylthiotransferase RimO, partial [Pseudomonadota bacterium]
MELKETICVVSLGCAKNLVDSEVMLGLLAKAGYGFTGNRKEADIIIVNTCAFIEDAAQESIGAIVQAAGEKKSGACKHLVVCGCLPQRYADELPAALPGVDLFIGTGEFQNIVKHLKALRSGASASKLFCTRGSFLMNARTPRILSTPGSSAYIKIAEGCSHRCTYCTIPSIRGPYAGRSAQSVVSEAKMLAARGIREINLISQDTTQYEGLAGLLRKLGRIPELKWIRLLYCHPLHVHKDTIQALAEEEKVCRYMDIPLQHVSDSVLKRMGRKITRKKTEAVLEVLRQAVPGISLRTTFIVGFPGETHKDFKELLKFVEDFRFDHLGAFQYRDEAGTPAFRLDGKVAEKTKSERFHQLMSLQAGIARERNKACVGKELEVLIEGPSSNNKFLLQGRTEFQAPEVDGVVFI